MRSFAEAVRWKPRAEDPWLFEAQALRTAGDTLAAAETCRRGIAAAGTSGRLRALVAELRADR